MITNLLRWWSRQVSKLTGLGGACAVTYLLFVIWAMSRIYNPLLSALEGVLGLVALFCILKLV